METYLEIHFQLAIDVHGSVSPVALFIWECPFLGELEMDLIIMGQRSEACGVSTEGWSEAGCD